MARSHGVKSPFFLTQSLLPLLQESSSSEDPARIIMVGSVDGLNVNAIAPGPFPSKMMAHTLETMGEQIRQGVPLQRVGEATDMAGAAIFLSSKASSYVTGIVIPVDGGITGCASTL